MLTESGEMWQMTSEHTRLSSSRAVSVLQCFAFDLFMALLKCGGSP